MPALIKIITFGLKFPIYVGNFNNSITNNIVKLKGITHVIIEDKKYYEYDETKLKRETIKIISNYNLVNEEAVGVIFRNNNKIKPVVYVKKINTLFLETACGSGTTALGLYEAYQNNNSIDLDIIQPSGLIINVKIIVKNKQFIKAIISGVVKELSI